MNLTAPPADWDFSARLTEVRARIVSAEQQCGRSGAGVQLLVATKTYNAEAVAAVVRAGATIVGESKMQELAVKGEVLREVGARVHVIGPLQRNKAAVAVEYAQCVQSVDSLRLAERLSRLCLEAERDLEVMIQVNVSGEDSKAGVAPEDALSLADAVSQLEGLTVAGFMTIGLNSTDEKAVRVGYARLRDIRDQALIRAERGDFPGLREAWHLSMGMSGDLEWAIAEGATLVRVGSAIMGERDYG